MTNAVRHSLFIVATTAFASLAAIPVAAQTYSLLPFAPMEREQSGPSVLAYAPPEESVDEAPAAFELPVHLKRQVVEYPTREAPGTIVIDTGNTYLYLVLGNGKAMRYGIGVGREGFTWAGTERVARKAMWPDWRPPQEMVQRQPYLPRFMAGGTSNPLGARAIYLGASIYRIHGTNAPQTIGKQVSSGCIRMTNEDVTDLYSRVDVGTKVVVLQTKNEARAPRDRLPADARAVSAQREYLRPSSLY